jgi:peroxiredoxin
VRSLAIDGVTMKPTLLAVAAFTLGAQALADPPAPPEVRGDIKLGHSAHGAAFNIGPRQRPTRMEGIGTSHFPITCLVPGVQDEVQMWFDQGNTLLHNFWYFEAERSFRWCLKLDPDCAMAWWGLARCSINPMMDPERGPDFLREAMARAEQVTDRERMYIEAYAQCFLPEFSQEELPPGPAGMFAGFMKLPAELERIIIAYPDDDEAKALFAVTSLFDDTRYGAEAVIRELLQSNPDHPGAHHYRIHLWDGEDGAMALDSCERYGTLAWASGHANHMPGHVYSGLGMWHEGAIWMDSATRVEQRYMAETMTMPYNNWNYAHNRNYLCFIQEQLGMPSLAIDAARRLIAVPLDPKFNDPAAPFGSVHGQGMEALVRALVKFERWDELLEPGNVPWGASPKDQMVRTHAEIRAHLGRGEIEIARAKRRSMDAAMRTMMAEGMPDAGDLPPGFDPAAELERWLNELDGRIALAEGDVLEGHRLLSAAAAEQHANYRETNDPPLEPGILYTALGEHHLEAGNAGLALACFEESLEVNPNDAFALSGVARAQHAIGNQDAARRAAGRLMHVWSDAERGLRWLDDVRSLGIDAVPIDESPREQRRYARVTLDELGPQRWSPYAAPALEALDSSGKRVTLDEYAGRNVLLVFYLGDECAHCMEQLSAIAKKEDEFDRRGVELLAISSKTVEHNAAAERLGELPFRLLSDVDHANAQRFQAYDDFENLELHATILIDGAGDIRWVRAGGDPFMDLDFLLGEIDRVAGKAEQEVVARP